MGKHVTICTWRETPHLTPEVQAEMLASMLPSQRKARSEGLPHMGTGLVWPVDEASVKIANFPLPHHWPRCFAFDTGWCWNAAIWLAWDKETDIAYLYDCYKRDAAEPPINAASIQARGRWIPGVADAADIDRTDGRQYIEIYKALGLDIELPDKTVETGIQQTWTRLSTGRLRVFESCVEWFEEVHIYNRNEKGIIPDTPRHDLMDATRYGCMSALNRAKTAPVGRKLTFDDSYTPVAGGWMGGI